jgi:hypothetical protein
MGVAFWHLLLAFVLGLSAAHSFAQQVGSRSTTLDRPRSISLRRVRARPRARRNSACPTAKEAFKIATENSFWLFGVHLRRRHLFVGVTSLMAEGTDAHPPLGKGVAGFGRYYWRGFADKTDGNYSVILALPTIFDQDERYYSMGVGGFWKRAIYVATRILISPNYHGTNTFNAGRRFLVAGSRRPFQRLTTRA